MNELKESHETIKQATDELKRQQNDLKNIVDSLNSEKNDWVGLLGFSGRHHFLSSDLLSGEKIRSRKSR